MFEAPQVLEGDTTVARSEIPGLRRIDRLVEQAALIMMPSGVVLILLGWSGASRTVLSYEQIPYLISGGLLGLGLMIGGGLLYVGGWVARAANMSAPAAPVDLAVVSTTAAAAARPRRPAAASSLFVRTPSGGMFHRTDCAIVAERPDVVTIAPDETSRFKACGMCDPLAV